jgi:hypothetical protein
MTFKQCRDLLGFVEDYKCTELIGSIRARLLAATTEVGLPAALFVFAGSRNDWALGREALSRMGVGEVMGLVVDFKTPYPSYRHSNFKSIPGQTKLFMEQLPAEWQSKLVHSLFYASYGQGSLEVDWTQVAKAFVEPDRIIERKR